jgi:hypothetical protein
VSLEKYPAEGGSIAVIGEIVSDMIERPESGKMDRKEFGRRGYKELEEQGIIKIKGNMVRWKR